jgi:pSer/pThr/pTyr-binding forkhead associated (FHA) protein
MSAHITLTATAGPLLGRQFVFTGPAVCTIGRSDECLLPIVGQGSNLILSRRHCALDIDPTAVRVRDLGSRNGTFVNGRKVGQRPRGILPSETTPAEREGALLHDGDRLGVGTSEFVVAIQLGTEEAVDAADFANCC